MANNNSNLGKNFFKASIALCVLVSSLVLISRCENETKNKKSPNAVQVNSEWIPVTERFLRTEINTHAGIYRRAFSYANNSIVLPSHLGSNEPIQTEHTIRSYPCLNMVENFTNIGNNNWKLQSEADQVIIISDPSSKKGFGDPQIFTGTKVIKDDLANRVCALVKVPRRISN